MENVKNQVTKGHFFSSITGTPTRRWMDRLRHESSPPRALIHRYPQTNPHSGKNQNSFHSFWKAAPFITLECQVCFLQDRFPGPSRRVGSPALFFADGSTVPADSLPSIIHEPSERRSPICQFIRHQPFRKRSGVDHEPGSQHRQWHDRITVMNKPYRTSFKLFASLPLKH